MEFANYFVLAIIALFANSVLPAEVPPECNVHFFPGNSASKVIVQNLAEGEYHVQLDSPVQERPTDLRNQNIQKYAGQKYPSVAIQCTSSYVADFSFEGVEAIQYLNIEKSRKFVPDDSQSNLVQNISVFAVLTPNATGEYVVYSIENPLVRTSNFIFAQTQTAPYLLGRGRRLVGTVNNNNIVIPCISANPSEQISLFQKSYAENQLYVQVNDPGVQYDRKIGFIIPRKRNTANRLLGEYRCTAAGQGLNAVDYVTVDVSERPLPAKPSHSNIHISVYRNGGAECVAPQGTKVQLVKLQVNTNEGAVLADCFAQQNKVCGDVVNQVYGVTDSWRSASSISSFTDASGFLVCYTDNEIVSTPFIRALDGIYYKRVQEIPVDLLLRVTIDNARIKKTSGSAGGKLSSKSSTRVLISSEAAEGAFLSNPRIYYVKHSDGSLSRIGEITYFETAQALEFYISNDITEVIVNDVLVQTGKSVNVARSLKTNRQQCDENEFRCDSDECIGADERCDHVIDCNDGVSDEANCTNYTRPCLASEFKCSSGQCVPDFKKCNQKFDCLDHSDEAACSATCAPDYFKCKNGECVRKSYACDSDQDCSDGSDEFAHICQNCNGDSTKFKCTLGGCISRDRVCDGEPNCDDKSDETPAACRPYVPRIVNSRSRYSFSKGEDHYLVCEVRIPAYAKAQPRFIPKVTWKEPDFGDFKRKHKKATYESIRQTLVKNHHHHNDSDFDSDNDIDESEYGYFYRLSDFDDYDVGVYVCEAKNEAGSTSRELTVAVDECRAPTTQRPGRPSRPDGSGSESGGEPSEGNEHEYPDHPFPFPPEDHFNCNQQGKHPDPDDCAVYHECIADGDKLNHYRFNCGPGTVYCPKSEHCGWERDCPCYDRKFTNRFTKKFKKVIKH